jgi:ferredoxin-NADP reductase
MSHIVKLLSSYPVANGTVAFEFEKPEGYHFTPGQATDWALVDPPETDAEGTSRSFTLACTPDEPLIRLATRMRDTAFKRTLGKLQKGDTIQADDPWGEFVLDPNDQREAVLLCGGIGVTPFYSMMKHAVQHQLPRKLTLFFSNKTPEDTPFREELLRFASQNPALRVIETMTDPVAGWTGETGFIDRAMLDRHLEDLYAVVYYTAGPPQMVNAMKQMLESADVQAEAIRLDEFLGY